MSRQAKPMRESFDLILDRFPGEHPVSEREMLFAAYATGATWALEAMRAVRPEEVQGFMNAITEEQAEFSAEVKEKR